ncbi:MAG TPA: thaumatin family protein [Vicinamibacteria bacterium]|nr:thaumatin family protein [Vicinamibacteria bacterium]
MRHVVGMVVVALAVAGAAGTGSAQTISVVNSCSYTVYPGIYPPVYQNGGWTMAPGSSVVISVPSNFNGRVWGRTGCDSSSPARCATGQCGGTGLQCAGTTGQAGTSLAEFNLNAAGTDWYNVSYVDGFDNPIGVSVLNGSCVSPNNCSTTPLTNCSADLRAGGYCLSPCTRYNTDQFCCRGAFGTAQTCNVSQWPASAQSYVNNIHAACPREYAYAYDDTVGLHTCPTGASYTITFCPGGGGAPPPPSPTPPPGGGISTTTWYTLVNQGNGKCVDDNAWGTTNGSTIIQWPCGSQQFNQEFQFQPTDSGYYRVMVRQAAWLGLDVTGGAGATGNGAKIQLWGVGTPAGTNQQWRPVALGNGFFRLVARHSGRCLDVPGQSTANGTQLQQWDCNGTVAQAWRLAPQP